MATQFIAHADEPRTFSDAKGARKAVKRDLAKHSDAHGDVLFATGTDVRETADGRFGIVVFVDLTPSEAKNVVGEELTGFIIQPDLEEKAPEPKEQPKEQRKSRKSGEINVDPMPTLIQARVGSKQQAIIDLLTKGATMDDLRAVCVRRDGVSWDDNSIRSALYYDVRQKGYGVRTEWEGDTARYHLVLPDGYDAPLEAKGRKS